MAEFQIVSSASLLLTDFRTLWSNPDRRDPLLPTATRYHTWGGYTAGQPSRGRTKDHVPNLIPNVPLSLVWSHLSPHALHKWHLSPPLSLLLYTHWNNTLKLVKLCSHPSWPERNGYWSFDLGGVGSSDDANCISTLDKTQAANFRSVVLVGQNALWR